MQNLKLFITGPRGFETLLFHELRELLGDTSAGAKKVYGGVEVSGALDSAYRICLHSRLANRVFCELARFAAADEAELYAAVSEIDWSEHLQARDSLAVAATVSRSKLTHNHFVALKTKDAIVDQFRAASGSRPVVEKKQPDTQVHINIHRNRATISLDLSGDSLHRRGYRQQHSGAPLKENLAAALLTQAGWSRDSATRLRLLDPMCGSGTFAIEAAMIAANIAPGIARGYFAFKQWRRHDAQLWEELCEQAREAIDRRAVQEIYASDYDASALEIARANAARADVADLIEFSHQQVAELSLPPTDRQTLVMVNPPWGQRLQSKAGLAELYADLGRTVLRLAPARLAMISANPDLLHRLGLPRLTRKPVRNGPLDCLFVEFGDVEEASTPAAVEIVSETDAAMLLPLRNRLVKNRKHLQRWARKNSVSCYRLYDADLPEFAFALDYYQSELSPGLEWFHLQEYQAPKTIDAELAAIRINAAKYLVRELFEVPEERLFCKLRSRQRGQKQYARQAQQNEFFQVREGAASLLINLSDYLDSGLFLDHRPIRERVYRESGGKSVLNLFCYTGAIGVQAGLGGAREVINVDLSATYLKWAEENHALNQLTDPARYRFLRADIIELLSDPAKFEMSPEYDLIFLDPPSFSNSARMRQTLDIQRDHADLIARAMRLLASDGLLLFSTNRRGFRLDDAVASAFSVEDITRATIAEDFRRSPRIHSCWEIRHSGTTFDA